MGTTPVCTYCGKLWPRNPGSYKDIPPVIAKEIRDHIQVCDKNPLVQKITKLQEALVKIKSNSYPGLAVKESTLLNRIYIRATKALEETS